MHWNSKVWWCYVRPQWLLSHKDNEGKYMTLEAQGQWCILPVYPMDTIHTFNLEQARHAKTRSFLLSLLCSRNILLPNYHRLPWLLVHQKFKTIISEKWEHYLPSSHVKHFYEQIWSSLRVTERVDFHDVLCSHFVLIFQT